MKARRPLALWVLLAMVGGVAAGELLGARAEPLSRLGTLILDVIKGLAGPLLFLAIVDAFAKAEIERRAGAIMVGISAINAVIALAIGLTISNLFQPGRSLRLIEPSTTARLAAVDLGNASKVVPADRRIDFLADLIGVVPTSVVRPFLDNAVLSIVILAVVAGMALRRIKAEQRAAAVEDYRAVESAVATGYRAVEVILGWAVRLVPLAVFGVVARTVGRYGLSPFRGLGVYLAVGISGLAIQVFVVYQAWVVLVARWPLRRFWAGSREAVATAAGVASSLATLPVTLRCLDKMGVRPESARLAACVGTNLNNDGILLYEAMAVLFVAQAAGVELSAGQQLLAAASCALAGIGISGIPEAGLISLVLVLRTVDLPAEAVAAIVPLLLTVDWILGRCRAITNVLSDILVAILLDRLAPRRPLDEPIP